MEKFILEVIVNNHIQVRQILDSELANETIKMIAERENLCLYDAIKKYLEELIATYSYTPQSYSLSFTDDKGYFTIISKIQ